MAIKKKRDCETYSYNAHPYIEVEFSVTFKLDSLLETYTDILRQKQHNLQDLNECKRQYNPTTVLLLGRFPFTSCGGAKTARVVRNMIVFINVYQALCYY